MKKAAQIFLIIGIGIRLIIAAPLAAIGIFEYIALTEAKKKSDINKILLALTSSECEAFISENCDVAKVLVEAGRVSSCGFTAWGENAYFFCNTTDEITIAYEYDFEAHTCEYISFIDKEQLPKTMAFYPEYYFAEKD